MKRFAGPVVVLLLSGGLAFGQPPTPPRAKPKVDPAASAQMVLEPARMPAGQPGQAIAERSTASPQVTSSDTGVLTLPTPTATGSVNPAGPPLQPALPPLPPVAAMPHEDFFGLEGDGSYRFWASAEYLLWWTKADHAPPLVTTGTTAGQGALGAPGTVVLFGGSDLPSEERSGGRFSAGVWLDHCSNLGIEGSFFFLGKRTNGATFDSSMFPVLARPIFSLNNFTETVELIAFPGLGTGSVSVSNSSELYSPEINLVKCCYSCCECNRATSVDVFAGFRYLDLKEDIVIREMIRVAPTVPTFGGSFVTVTDRFATRNEFYGPQIGVDASTRRGPWVANFRGKLGAGVNHQIIDISGNQTITAPSGATSVFTGGLLALSSNSGHFSRDVFSLVPEVGVNLGYQFSDYVGVFVGYTFLYWTKVVRPGEQIDRVVDITQIPNFPTAATPTGIARPTVPFHDTGYWAQGLNFGIEFTW